MVMDRKAFLQKSILAFMSMNTLSSLKAFTDRLPIQGKRMPVLFTSHGDPMDIPLSRQERAFWNALFELGKDLQKNFEVKAALVVSAHWCTRGTFVNISPEQKQIYDYYGFPENYYKVYYHAKGSPEIANEVKKIVSSVSETTDWGLGHGAWPMLMHLFPNADVPVFQMSIDYYAKPEYHYELGKQLKSHLAQVFHRYTCASQFCRSVTGLQIRRIRKHAAPTALIVMLAIDFYQYAAPMGLALVWPEVFSVSPGFSYYLIQKSNAAGFHSSP
jgi:hypothetical protein